LLALLLARGVPIEPTVRARIFDERDLVRLDRWITRAANGATLADLLVD
jgi:hypothetical protein